jgi:hypothetical protein
MNRYPSVLWMPPGTARFGSRQTWGKRVAYASQFLDPDNRAHRGQAKIKARLIVDLDPDEWELATQTKMDALEHLQPVCAEVRWV